jgi:hypothetical protein
MIAAPIFLVKLVLAHLLTDFLLQPHHWVKERNSKHFSSPKLYLHGAVTTLAALLLTGLAYWKIALVIGITHTLIDGWKSYQQENIRYFLLDQLLHFFVIAGCWYHLYFTWRDVQAVWQQLNNNLAYWQWLTAFIFVTHPAAILIGQLTRQWRDKLPEAESLANAGKWIGIIERTIILTLVSLGQYAAIGLLVAAKGFIRYSEKDRPEIKTEYLVVGTLLSIGLALLTGLVVKHPL